MSKQRVQLVELQGDQIEFADLLGTVGVLSLPGVGLQYNWFMPDNRGDWLEFSPKTIKDKDNKISVETKRGNTFVFQKVA